MLFAIVKKTQKPIKIVSWTYLEPGKLAEIQDETRRIHKPWKLIPIGHKTYQKMVNATKAKHEALDSLT